MTSPPSGRGNVAALEAQRLGDAQARAVEQCQHRGIAGENPGIALLAGAQIGVGHALGGRDRERLRQRLRELGRAHGGKRAHLALAVALEEAREGAHAREHAHQRAAADAVGAPCGEKGAHVERRKARQRRQRHPAVEMAGQEAEELAQIALIGLDRFRRHPPFGRQVCEPAREFARDLGGRENEVGSGCCA